VSGLQDINYRIPDEWSAPWFARFIRDVLANADVRNAISGTGITITGTPDVPATISSGIDVQQLISQPYILAVPSTPAGFLTHERVLIDDPDGVIIVTDGGPNSNLSLSIAAIPYNKLPLQPPTSLLGNAFEAIDNPSPIEGTVQYAIPHIADVGLGVLNILFSPIDHNYVSDFNEAAQDAVGGILVTTSSIILTYNDGTPSITADVDQSFSPTWTGTHTFTNPVLFANGSDTAPSITFASDTNTGIYRLGTDNFGFTTGGVLRWDIDTTDIVFTLPQRGPIGSDATPTYSFAAHTGTGMFWQDASGSSGSADELAFTVGGVHMGDWGSLGLDTGVPFRANTGSASAPSFTFWISGDSNTGMFRVSEDILGFSTNGVERLRISTVANIATLPWRGQGGTAGAPAFSFSGDTDTGIYSNSLDQFRFATGGVERFNISVTGLDCAVPIRVNDGSASTPAYAFYNDVGANTGLYRISEDTFGVTTGGTLRLTFSTTAFTGTLPWRGQDGTAAAPSFSFSGDTDTGMYVTSTANTLGFSTAGVVKFQIGASGQWGIGGATYGTSGQALLSGGASAAPTWGNPTLVAANFANPTASVGLTAVNGSAVTAMRSDASPALDQSITPTWTGIHDHRALVYLNPNAQTPPAAAIASDAVAIAMRNAAMSVEYLAIGTSLNLGTRCISAGGTYASPTAITSANIGYMGYLGAAGHDGTTWTTGSAGLFGIAPGGDWSNTSHPTQLTFETTAVGSTTRTIRARVSTDGQLLLSDGSVTQPSQSFINDPDTGIYRIGADNIGVSVGGVKVADFATGLVLFGLASDPVGDSAAPRRYKFGPSGNTGNNTTEFFALDGSPQNSYIRYNTSLTSSPTDIVSGNNVGQLNFRGYDTTTAAPQSGASIVATATENWSSTARGTKLEFGSIAATTTTSLVPLTLNGTQAQLLDGSVSVPSLSYVNDTDSGMFLAAANGVGVAAGGTEAARFDATATAGNTRFLIYDVDNATLERVTVGAADSGGTGYKVLRIPN